MSVTTTSAGSDLLVYEPRVEGHHPGWLRFIAEDLLSAGYDLTLAVDLRARSRDVLEQHLGPLLNQVRLLPAVDDHGRPRGGSTVRSVASALRGSGASRALLCALDELASRAFRRAALGLRPPRLLYGKVGGIFHRPRFTIAPWWSPNRWLKASGFRRLMDEGWFRPLLMVDEYLAREFQQRFPARPVRFLPDPCPDGFAGDGAEARTRLQVPADRIVFLFFGVGARRKGLHLAVEAMLRLRDSRAFLLVAGRQAPGPDVQRGLDRLQRDGRAAVLNRYVSGEEEQLCFRAADWILLPYVNHFGTSGVLSRAMAVQRPVIVSDEQLLGRLVGEHDLGWRFPSGDVAALRERLAEAVVLDGASRQRYAANAARYAARHSRAAYRAALLESLTA